MPVSVIFNQINVVSMVSNSVIASGQNSQPDWNSQGKFNLGNGFAVNSAILGSTNIINDQDVCDTPITQPENINPQPVSQF
ncbi:MULTISPECIES: hypothetical protein [Priestia]|jgi:hypothetical protein|uniref:Spore germination protein n=3 Tax=Bacillaceae TaxID=186817 RepID=A0A2A9Y9X7_PRIMG|nr:MULTISPECIES: hypothetical protein [Priestia]AVX08027.1 hypothetical protein CS527_10075 [Bacillus sp. Y-01]KOP74200.1 hypothetical protein AMS61_07625 [Bacillus sp. FJAT-21351]KQU25709.1 hypothetical protein ASG61_17690 [Bacillus sp. Leaf75]KRF55483.1 hypothetical protein ASG98_00170 [Bacillus sp. Soil531]MBZ5480743.1 hypothetical protein [Bacillus sp. T_4]MCF6795842.1 hypothetical protein [Bacillus sp. ET1]MCJ7986547.1 hypothetical protein [Priestia sp. OVL9]MDH6655040.1 hypothetical p